LLLLYKFIIIIIIIIIYFYFYFKDGEKKLKKKKKNKFRSQDEMNNNISEDLFIRILDNEKNKIKSHYALFNRTLKKRRPKRNINIIINNMLFYIFTYI